MRGSAAFRTGVAPGGALAPGWVKNELWRRARAVPSLDLRFAENKSLVDATTGASLVTFTRASSGTFVGSDGVLRTAVTNFALNTVWAGGTTPTSWALAGTPDTPTIVSSTLGSADGAIALSFTSSASRGYLTQTFALAANATYVFSVYVEAISGYASGSNNVISLNNGPAGSTITGAVGTPVVGGRIFCSIANGATAGNVQLRVGLGVGSNATGTIILSRPQLEQSTTVGKYIPTTSVINSAPRFDHNPTTGESLGLLVEEARTNSIRNNTGVGAVAGTPGTLPTNWSVASSVSGLSSQIIGTGTESGIAYIDIKWTGTPSANGTIQHTFESNTNTAAVSGQSWTSAVYQRLVGGVIPGTTSLLVVERSVANSFLASSSTNVTVTDSALINQRLAHSRTLNNALTAYVNSRLDVSVVSGVAVDFTFRIGLPQLELGAFATSPILTSTAAATRSADVASITGTNFSSWANNNEGTIFSDSSIIASQIKTQAVWDLTGGIALSSLRQPQGTANQFRAVIGGTFTGSPGTGASFTTGVTLAAVAYSGTAGRLQIGSVGTDATGSTLDATSLSIGSLAGTSQLNGRIKRLCFWPARLPDATLQQITQ